MNSLEIFEKIIKLKFKFYNFKIIFIMNINNL